MPKRGENIYKRKDGRWEGRYIRGRTASGQAEYGYVYADSYKACRAKRQQCIETLPEKPAVQASAATLAQAAELFLSEKILESVFLSDAALYLACFGNGPYLSADGGSDF